MSILSIHNLGKYYGAQDVFSNLEASIARGDKIALVGPNGAGKTTLIRIMLGLEPATQGRVDRARNLAIGYLPQQPEFSGDGALYDEMLSVYADLRDQEQRLQNLAQDMAAAADPEALMERYADAEHRFELAGGYVYEQQIRRVLSGLGFGEETFDWPISLLSGGQVTRALLAKLLLEDPELLILDEPTNYLDLDALEWLESYLIDWPRSLLVISHDRYFLDRVVTRIWEMDHGGLETYRGNYSHYVEQREARLLRRQREYDAQQAFIAKTEDFIRRYKAGQRTREAQGRETRLARLERLEAPKNNQRIRLRLETDLRAGDNVLASEGAIIGHGVSPAEAAGNAASSQAMETHGEFPLFETGSFLIQRGDRVALLGPNGSGKTTFLRTLMGQLEPLSGSLRVGASLNMGYLPQNQDWLDPNKQVLDQILDMSNYTVQQARGLLGRYLFTGDDVYKMTGDLSGGELARVALSVLSINNPNFLILDEPTTHLDVASQEILQDVLADFNGTVLLVSHDRYLIDALATHVFWIEDNRLHTIEGNYTAYVAYRRENRAARAETDPNVRTREKQRRQQRREQAEERRREEQVTELESEIERVERELTATTGMIERASKVQDVGRLHKLGDEYQRLESLLAQKLHEWERISGVSQHAN